MSEQILISQLSKSELKEIIKSSLIEVLKQNRKKESALMNSHQLCKWLGISLSTLAVWKRENKIPYKRMGKRIFFSKTEVLKALEESNFNRLKELGA